MKRLINIVLIISMLVLGGCASGSTPPSLVEDKGEQIVVTQEESTEVSEDEATDSDTKDETPIEDENELEKPVAKTPKSNQQINLTISQNFGQLTVFNQAINFNSDDTLLQLMQNNLDLETSYGNSFISSINGIKMRQGMKRSDWFFYINGIASHTGLRDYKLNAGDKIFWDYHLWSAGPTNNAIIGAYPEPFLHGYRGNINPTKILYDTDSQALAQKLTVSLNNRGVRVDNNLISNNIDSSGPTIIIGTWPKLANNSAVNNINNGYQKNGTSVHFTDQGLDLLNYKGQVARTVMANSAVIAAYGKSLGDPNPVWLIIGTDELALNKAINILINSPGDIRGLYSIAILAEGLTPLPLK
ncbi:MAG TPA: DUF4430 domain-containing protein [Syntrophomonadaceae bacterium]|nr:DUF4430 domain-containing protein [Syntrophomonadaceae bacterium]